MTCSKRLAVQAGLLFVWLVPATLLASAARSGPRIVNGLLTSGYPSTGALLKGNDPDSATAHCTGIMIGCETFLTAAHCVCDSDGAACQSGAGAPDPNAYLVFLQHAGFSTLSSIALRTDYDFPEADVAVIKLASPVNGISPTSINTMATPPFGTTGTIIGFGRTGGISQDLGLKHFGAIETASCSGGISNTTSVCWDFTAPVGPPGDDSNTCNADSGGPLLVDLGAGEVVAGITSGGDASDCLAPDESYDANVYHYRSWIQTEGGADLSNTSCGTLPQVGDPSVTVHGFSGTISAAKPESRHSFSVPLGTLDLRVTMNADEAGSNDFDLFVKAGAPPTTSDYDCRAFGGNQWGICDFATPAVDTWHILIDRFDGDGEYQATASVFVLPGCGLGVELVVLLPPLLWSRTRGRRRRSLPS